MGGRIETNKKESSITLETLGGVPSEHLEVNMPHLATDPTTSTQYRWGLAVQDGVWGYQYEEVV